MIACVYNTAQVMAVELVVRIAHFFFTDDQSITFYKSFGHTKELYGGGLCNQPDQVF